MLSVKRDIQARENSKESNKKILLLPEILNEETKIKIKNSSELFTDCLVIPKTFPLLLESTNDALPECQRKISSGSIIGDELLFAEEEIHCENKSDEENFFFHDNSVDSNCFPGNLFRKKSKSLPSDFICSLFKGTTTTTVFPSSPFFKPQIKICQVSSDGGSVKGFKILKDFPKNVVDNRNSSSKTVIEQIKSLKNTVWKCRKADILKPANKNAKEFSAADLSRSLFHANDRVFADKNKKERKNSNIASAVVSDSRIRSISLGLMRGKDVGNTSSANRSQSLKLFVTGGKNSVIKFSALRHTKSSPSILAKSDNPHYQCKKPKPVVRTDASRRHRHSVASHHHNFKQNLSYFKLYGISVGPTGVIFNQSDKTKNKLLGSTSSLFSTAVISGSSSAPNLRDTIGTTTTVSGKKSRVNLYQNNFFNEIFFFFSCFPGPPPPPVFYPGSEERHVKERRVRWYSLSSIFSVKPVQEVPQKPLKNAENLLGSSLYLSDYISIHKLYESWVKKKLSECFLLSFFSLPLSTRGDEKNNNNNFPIDFRIEVPVMFLLRYISPSFAIYKFIVKKKT